MRSGSFLHSGNSGGVYAQTIVDSQNGGENAGTRVSLIVTP